LRYFKPGKHCARVVPLFLTATKHKFASRDGSRIIVKTTAQLPITTSTIRFAFRIQAKGEVTEKGHQTDHQGSWA
jgi:hypothetical protein